MIVLAAAVVAAVAAVAVAPVLDDNPPACREKQRGGLNLPEPAPARGRREGTNRTRSNRTGMYIFNSVHFLRCSV